ncbi:hypothetical protein LTR70_005794 [Exophiala xenobiotica]|uniref:Amidase domain-containing protein n=1 Tax=Lithohypha guttulata TaxID=1690604 RepID=A0ABR0K0C7_9EURO|nr:hypothetical protein LTR24_008820 [Lithohypha guttulata]KAK5317599.1 hypothetical protein LTR70_005794 [Exophiala xenobiotica]
MDLTNPPPTDLWQQTATQILPLLLTSQITVETYAKSLLSRINTRNPQIKAWIHLDETQILARARELDALPPSQRGPLHGLAIGIKDIILTADMPTQYNSPIHYTTSASGIDAPVVRALRASGALILGKTSTTEFAATTKGNVNQNFTRNAHAADRTPGGSSSGSAAAVADFQVPVAFGTQTGGSVVRPASFNGIWGVKWTWGAVSTMGVGMYSVTNDTLGVLGRCAEDLELVSRVLRVQADDVADSKEVNIEGARIAFCRTHVWGEKAGEGLRRVWGRARALLEAGRARVEELELPEEFANMSKWHAAVQSGEARNSFLGVYLADKERLDASLCAHVENATNVSRKALLEAYDGCARPRPVWDRIASEYDAVLTPGVPDEAPLGLDWTGDAAFNTMWSILHAPTVNVPGLKGKNGMPVGLTVVGARYTDMRTLNAARHIGKIFESQTS